MPGSPHIFVGVPFEFAALDWLKTLFVNFEYLKGFILSIDFSSTGSDI